MEYVWYSISLLAASWLFLLMMAIAHKPELGSAPAVASDVRVATVSACGCQQSGDIQGIAAISGWPQTGSLPRGQRWRFLRVCWFCVDCEIMPWSVEAQELIYKQYAAVGASANSSLASAIGALTQAQASGVDVAGPRV